MKRFSLSQIDTRPLILGGMLGATLEYLWDPDKGRSRRAVTRDQLRSSVRRGLWHIRRQMHYLEGPTFGAIEETLHLHEPDNPRPDDATLRDRVESKLFRDGSVLKEDININVAVGVVELRGQVDSHDDIVATENKVRAIEGVHAIHNYLHLPQTPAPNKATALSVSKDSA
jgi:BON domain